MAKIVRGQTRQKGCHVCGKPLKKIGESSLIVAESNGKIALEQKQKPLIENPRLGLYLLEKQKKTNP